MSRRVKHNITPGHASAHTTPHTSKSTSKLDRLILLVHIFSHLYTVYSYILHTDIHDSLRAYSVPNLKDLSIKLQKNIHPAFKNDKTLINYVENNINDTYNCITSYTDKETTDSYLSNLKTEPFKLLSGLTFTVKDNFTIKNQSANNGSKLLSHYIPSYTATAVRLLLEAGSFMLGRSAMDEFAMGSKNPTVINPLNKNIYAGGSSGGCAAAIAAGFTSFGISSDTGGSTRIPASYCGIVGFRPTTNLISRFGLTELCSYMDSVGIMTKEVDQIYPILYTLSEYDPNDMSRGKMIDNVPNRSKECDLSKPFPEKDLVINIPNKLLSGTDSQKESFNQYYNDVLTKVKETLLSHNINVKNVVFPNNNDIIKTYYIYVSSQTRTNLARFRGTKYKLGDTFDINTELLGAEPRRRYIMGELALKSSNPDAIFNNLRENLNEWAQLVFSKNSYLLLPTHVEEPQNKLNPLEDYDIDDSYVILSSILGLPSLTIPINSKSIQLVGPKYSDFNLLNIACHLKRILIN